MWPRRSGRHWSNARTSVVLGTSPRCTATFKPRCRAWLQQRNKNVDTLGECRVCLLSSLDNLREHWNELCQVAFLGGSSSSAGHRFRGEQEVAIVQGCASHSLTVGLPDTSTPTTTLDERCAASASAIVRSAFSLQRQYKGVCVSVTHCLLSPPSSSPLHGLSAVYAEQEPGCDRDACSGTVVDSVEHRLDVGLHGHAAGCLISRCTPKLHIAHIIRSKV